MPSYQYACKECKETFKRKLAVSQMKKPRAEPCPNCGVEDSVDLFIGSPSIVGGVTVEDKRPDGFRDVLKRVHETAGKKSTVNT